MFCGIGNGTESHHAGALRRALSRLGAIVASAAAARIRWANEEDIVILSDVCSNVLFYGTRQKIGREISAFNF
jgi:hypothetical protein